MFTTFHVYNILSLQHFTFTTFYAYNILRLQHFKFRTFYVYNILRLQHLTFYILRLQLSSTHGVKKWTISALVKLC